MCYLCDRVFCAWCERLVVSVTEKGAIALRHTPRTPQGDRLVVSLAEKERSPSTSRTPQGDRVFQFLSDLKGEPLKELVPLSLKW